MAQREVLEKTGTGIFFLENYAFYEKMEKVL